ncbi:MAG: TonB-dependent receptor [Opitutaceae bacterium]|nr:TonB-dependent receptor [Opitutaceae bacterium]
MTTPTLAVLALTFLAHIFPARGATPAKPNIILFLVDDMGWMDTTVNGSKYYETPNMERFAKRAMRFTDAYATPLCSPSRASILTGKSPLHHGMTTPAGHSPPHARELRAEAPPSAPFIYPITQTYMDPSEYTLAEALRDADYRTAHLGKWHLGLTRPHWPEQQGFAVAFHAAPDPGPPSYFSPYGVKPEGEPANKNHVGTITNGPPGEYITDRLTDEAIKFITDNRERPFFLNLWHYGVHGPWGFKPKYAEAFMGRKDPRGKQGNPIMAAMLQSVDESLGRLLDKLDELKLTENTLFIFFSDNGGNDFSNVADLKQQEKEKNRPPTNDLRKNWLKFADNLPPTSNAPLRAGKGTLYEGGVRVPLMIAWPGVVQPGSTSTAIVHAYDLYPTLLDALGLAPNPVQKMDGISIIPALKQTGPLARSGVYHYFPHTLFGIPPGVSVRAGDWKLIRWFETNAQHPNAHELYNLKDDIGETKNLAGQMPDKVKQLDALIDGFLATGDVVPKPNPRYERASDVPAPDAAARSDNRADNKVGESANRAAAQPRDSRVAQTEKRGRPINRSQEEDAVKLDHFVVTGVFDATAVRKATVSISTIDAEMMAAQVARSADDLLLDVPGVFVNSSLGEIRGMVYSRGISVNSSDGANGHYYVSMQEDGLPITNVNFSNYGTSYFNRSDATLRRVEAVRGGSAAITAANAPGGVFNYITKTGTPEFGGELRTRFGMEGDWSPMYRVDLNIGGPVSETGWLYHVGGFYRVAEGHRPLIGYPVDDGYQVRANLFKDYGNGSAKIYAKYLNDRNYYYDYLLAFNPQDPKQAPGLSRYSTDLFPASKHSYPREAADNLDTYDTTEKVHNRQRVIGLDWRHEFGDGWSVHNNAKFSRSWADWNSAAGPTPRSLDWPNFFSAYQLAFSGGPFNARVPAGTYQFRSRETGALLAEVTSNGSYAVTGAAPSNPGQVVTYSALPNQHIQANTLWVNNGLVFNNHIDDLMEQFSVTKRTNRMTFTAGGFFAYADIDHRQSSAGLTASPLTEQPVPVAVTWIPATAANAPAGTSAAALAAVEGWNGQTAQLTNHAGYTALGRGYSRAEAVARQRAMFFGHKWDIHPRWGIDWGFRFENYAVKGYNGSGIQNPRANWDPTYGGADGNPLTLYDNRFVVPNPANKWHYDKDVDSFSWSAASNFVINDRNSFYIRYADGEKAPDFQFFRAYASQFRLDNLKGRPQTVKQWELGYRYKNARYTFTATPFWSRLGDINSNPQAIEADGITPYYPDPIYNAVTSYGLELEGRISLTERLSLRTVFTWQESEGTVWKIFQAGGPGRDDDTYLDFSGKPSDNNPDFILKNTLSYQTKKFFANIHWKHMGERAGNVANVIVLPRFNQFDLALGYTFSKRLSFTFNINNVLDGEGVMTWRGWGVSPGDRQSFTTLPADPKSTMLQYIPIQPRAYYLSTTYKF